MPTGTITQLSNPAAGVAGQIQYLDSGNNTEVIGFTISLPSTLVVGSVVDFDIDDYTDPKNPVAINIKAHVTGDPNEPADQGSVQAGVTINGNFSVPAGQTVTLSASIVNGTVNVGNNARIIIKSHGGNPSRISKGLKATGAAEVIFYNSEIGGTVVFNNSGKFSASKGKLSSTVVTNNNTGAIVFDGVAIDDSLVATNNASISVANCTINGDLILQHNASCSSPTGSNTVSGENNGCQS